MLSSTWAKAITEPEECFLIDLIQDSDHSALDDFIFQGAYPEGTLTTASFGDISPVHWLCPIGPLMHPGMQVLKPWLQVLPILLPRHPVHAWGGIPLEREVRLPQALYGQMMA